MKKMQKGSFTIEASMLLPILLLVVSTVITILFYWHDRNVLKGIAYETAVVGAERTGTGEEELKLYAGRLIKGKLLWFPTAKVTVQKTEEEVTVTAKAQHCGMRAEAKSVMTNICPEKMIRRKEHINEDILQK